MYSIKASSSSFDHASRDLRSLRLLRDCVDSRARFSCASLRWSRHVEEGGSSGYSVMEGEEASDTDSSCSDKGRVCGCVERGGGWWLGGAPEDVGAGGPSVRCLFAQGIARRRTGAWSPRSLVSKASESESSEFSRRRLRGEGSAVCFPLAVFDGPAVRCVSSKPSPNSMRCAVV